MKRVWFLPVALLLLTVPALARNAPAKPGTDTNSLEAPPFFKDLVWSKYDERSGFTIVVGERRLEVVVSGKLIFTYWFGATYKGKGAPELPINFFTNAFFTVINKDEAPKKDAFSIAVCDAQDKLIIRYTPPQDRDGAINNRLPLDVLRPLLMPDNRIHLYLGDKEFAMAKEQRAVLKKLAEIAYPKGVPQTQPQTQP